MTAAHLAGLLLALVGLVGCAPSYWIKIQPAREVRAVRYVPAPCGVPTWDGCSNFGPDVIEIKNGLDAATEACVLAHELKHFQGYAHAVDVPNYRHNCGDG